MASQPDNLFSPTRLSDFSAEDQAAIKVWTPELDSLLNDATLVYDHVDASIKPYMVLAQAVSIADLIRTIPCQIVLQQHRTEYGEPDMPPPADPQAKVVAIESHPKVAKEVERPIPHRLYTEMALAPWLAPRPQTDERDRHMDHVHEAMNNICRQLYIPASLMPSIRDIRLPLASNRDALPFQTDGGNTIFERFLIHKRPPYFRIAQPFAANDDEPESRPNDLHIDRVRNSRNQQQDTNLYMLCHWISLEQGQIAKAKAAITHHRDTHTHEGTPEYQRLTDAVHYADLSLSHFTRAKSIAEKLAQQLKPPPPEPSR